MISTAAPALFRYKTSNQLYLNSSYRRESFWLLEMVALDSDLILRCPSIDWVVKVQALQGLPSIRSVHNAGDLTTKNTKFINRVTEIRLWLGIHVDDCMA